MSWITFFFVAAAFQLETYLADTNAEVSPDADIYDSIVYSLHELQVQRAAEADGLVIQRASSVCYDEIGCFDIDGTFKHLKQLPDPPESINTQFLLYTRKNRYEPQLLDYKKPETIMNSNLDPKLPLKIATHGFGGKNNLTWLWNMKNAFLEMHDVNMIVVDWSLGARLPYYLQAAVNSELVGAQIANLFFIIKDKLGIQEKDLHCVGFSLGAQVMGFVGKKMMEMQGVRPGRISGLDPASPLFEDYGGEVHLYKDDADSLDVIHTNADLLIYGGVGMGMPIGHVDFYPNGGKRQPGCKSTIGGVFNDIFKNNRAHACNHERAVHLYIDSILNPDLCRFQGFKCGNYSDFERAECMSCEDDCGHMGYHAEGQGIYYLLTKEKSPFCTDIVKMAVQFAKDIKRSYGRIILTLSGTNDEKMNITLTEKEEKLVPGDERTLVITLGDQLKPLKKVDVLYQRYNGWFTKGTGSFTLSSVSISSTEGDTIFKTCEGPIVLNDQEYKTLPSC